MTLTRPRRDERTAVVVVTGATHRAQLATTVILLRCRIAI